jgi:hypothetical protein
MDATTVKFGQLPPGAAFRYRGQEWVKTSPLLARSTTGAVAPVPRGAVVQVQEAARSDRGTRAPVNLSPARLQQELSACAGQLQELLVLAANGADLRKLRARQHEVLRQLQERLLRR